MKEKGFVAGTILATNQKGESFFLVHHENEILSFLLEKVDEDATFPMGIIMRSLLQHVKIDSESLRIVDATNIRSEDFDVPLFVFDLTERPENPDELLTNSENVTWRRSKDLSHLLNNCDFSGVPVYRSESYN